MIETLFMTHIPVYVIIVFAIGLFLIGLEIATDVKGALAVLGGLAEILGIILAAISGVPIIEIVFLLLISALMIMMMLNTKNSKNLLGVANGVRLESDKNANKASSEPCGNVVVENKIINEINNSETQATADNITAMTENHATTEPIIIETTTEETKSEVTDVI